MTKSRSRHAKSNLPLAFYLTDPVRSSDILHSIRWLPKNVGVIYRHFGAQNAESVAEEIRNLCWQSNRVFLIAADPRLAVHVSADGVHWPERQRSEFRRWSGRSWLHTTSSHSWPAVHHAAKDGFHATLFSAVFPSNSPSAGPALGAIRYRLGTQRLNIETYALGGVTAKNHRRIGRFAAVSMFEENVARIRT